MSEHSHRAVAGALISASNNGDAGRRVRAWMQASSMVVRSVLDTVNGYRFTPMVAAEEARRVLAGEVRPGFQTPAGLFGNGFAETIADTRITDIETLEG